MGAVLEEVRASFAAHAPGGTTIVVKNHPLDTGLFPYRRLIGRLTRGLGLPGRVKYLETGDLATLLRHTRGVVTVNPMCLRPGEAEIVGRAIAGALAAPGPGPRQ